MKKTLIAALIAASAITSVPAMADSDDRGYSRHSYDRYDDDDDRRDYRESRRHHRTDNGIRYWRGNDGRYYCRRGDGTTGLLVGAALGALLGRSVDTYGDRAPGTILGAAAGALLGREVDRGRTRCR